MQQFLRDEFDPKIRFTITESSEVDGTHILAKVAGQFFSPENSSRNNRYYSKNLWEKVLNSNKVKSLLNDRRMFGTISHEQNIDDKALLDGKLSHIVTKLEIMPSEKGEVGYGEALILNTPAGNILNTVIRANSKVFVSSRAFGKYKGNVNGVPKVDEDSYDFRTFDFVLEPGFLEANPSLAESYNKLNEIEGEINMGGNELNEKMLDNIINENKELRTDLTNALNELEKYKSDNLSLSEENLMVKESVKILDSYKDLGSAEEILEALNLCEKEITSLRGLKKGLSSKVEAYKKLGETSEISKVFDVFESTRNKLIELTDAKSVGEALSLTERSIDLALEKLTKYSNLGSIAEITEVFNRYEKLLKKMEESAKLEEIRSIAKDLGISKDLVEKVYGKMDKKAIKEFFTKVKNENKTVVKYSGRNMNESVSSKSSKEKSVINESRGERLMKKFMV